jgi:hypothetical protein
MQPMAQALGNVKIFGSPGEATENICCDFFRPFGTSINCRLPSAYALGCILTPLRGYIHNRAGVQITKLPDYQIT